MASKPAQPATWNTSGANRTTPSGGLQASGWGLTVPAVSSYFNWWQNLVDQWTQYLDDGDLEGDHTIDGNIEVTSPTSGKGEVRAEHVYVTEGWVGRAYALPRRYPAACGHFITGTGTYELAGKVSNAATSDVFEVPIPQESVEDISTFSASVDPAASGVVTMDIVRVSSGATIASISSSGASLQTITTPAIGTGATGPYVARFSFTLSTGHLIHFVETEVTVTESVLEF